MLPVLIVCFARPENLRLLLNMPEVQKRQIYIFVDGANEPGKIKELNAEVLEIIHSNKLDLSINLLRSEINVGVKNAVPMAVDWAMTTENALIILEDDCMPSTQAFSFFDEQIRNLNSNTLMVCGSAPKKAYIEVSNLDSTRYANYPLIWGWATNRESWDYLSLGIDRKRTPWILILRKILVTPRLALAVLFFAAANVRVKNGILNAWDSPVALEMLIKSYQCILPLESLIINNGDDPVASHPPKNQFSYSKRTRNANDVNRRIEREIYNMKIRNAFSPLKAYLEVLTLKYPKKIEFFRMNQFVTRIFKSG
jgi:hypothetical protein